MDRINFAIGAITATCVTLAFLLAVVFVARAEDANYHARAIACIDAGGSWVRAVSDGACINAVRK